MFMPIEILLLKTRARMPALQDDKLLFCSSESLLFWQAYLLRAVVRGVRAAGATRARHHLPGPAYLPQ